MAEKPEWWDIGVASAALGDSLLAAGMDQCLVTYYGTVEAIAGANIEASVERPLACAVNTKGEFVPASWGDYVVGMAKSSAKAGERVVVEIRLPRPEDPYR